MSTFSNEHHRRKLWVELASNAPGCFWTCTPIAVVLGLPALNLRLVKSSGYCSMVKLARNKEFIQATIPYSMYM